VPRRQLIREVNERIRTLNTSLGAVGASYAVICECEEFWCIERFEVPAKLHAAVCTLEDCYIVIAGHERADADRVIGRGDSFLVVGRELASAAA
jgi:hypothetical protein